MSTNGLCLGWLGTGRMGAALAGRLIDAGERVTVWNRTAVKTEPLVARGARAVGRLTDLGSCDIVFVTVSGPRDLVEVVAEGGACIVASGPAGVFQRVRPYLDAMAKVFTTELLRKDFDLGLEAARSLEVPMPVAATVHQLIQSAIGIGLREEDFLPLYDQQARGAGLVLESEG